MCSLLFLSYGIRKICGIYEEALDLWKEDIFLYYKEDKEITHFIVVLLPNLASQALAWLVQWYGVNLEPVPNLSGKPYNLIQDQKNKKIKISKKLQDISD